MSISRFAANADEYLRELRESLQNGSFRPHPVARVYIPKAPGKTRPLGIPAVKDRIVQTALKMVLEPILENEFLPSSYGFRPGRGCKDALREVDTLLKAGYTWVVDADLAEYFDSIPHGPMLSRVQEKVSDGRVLDLVRRFVDNDIVEGTKRWTPTSGTPQGAVITPPTQVTTFAGGAGSRGRSCVRVSRTFGGETHDEFRDRFGAFTLEPNFIPCSGPMDGAA